MKRLALIACTLAMTGCASSAAYSELSAAEAEVRPYVQSEFYSNVDLADKREMSEREREQVIAARYAKVEHCAATFSEDFDAALNGASSEQEFYTNAQRADDAFGACIAPAGLVGWPEFKVGNDYLRTREFARRAVAAHRRLKSAQQWVGTERERDRMAWAIGLAGIPRTSYVQPAPITCLTTRGTSTTAVTTCR